MSVDGGYVWQKTIVDNKCFSRMQAVVHFDRNHKVTSTEITDGEFITEEEYEAGLAAQEKARAEAIAAEEAAAAAAAAEAETTASDTTAAVSLEDGEDAA